jgi:hypothetical protein
VFLESAEINIAKAVKAHFAQIVAFPSAFSAPDLADLARWIQQQRFDAVFYPSIGMHVADVLLANLRLSQVQVTTYGHSTSTHGSKIDYFLCSKEVEQVAAVAAVITTVSVPSMYL